MSESGIFRLEKDLVAVLRASSPALLDSSFGPCRVLSEAQIGSRIPDLLLIYSPSDSQYVPVRITYFDCAILASVLNGAPTSLTDLANALYSPLGDLIPRVDRLVRSGLLGRRLDGTVTLSSGAVPQDLRIVAVEAKLHRWREALTQAQSYFTFANESYIAMPSSAVRCNVQALGACANAGVGVIAVDQNDASILLDGETRQPRSAEWVRLVSSVVGVSQVRALATASASRQAR